MILITGAGGWLGSELTEQLLKKGESIKAFNYIETDSLKKLKEQYGEQLEIVIGDVCNIEMLDKALEDIDTIYHLAAKVHVVPTNQQEEDEFYQINTYASEKLFEKAIEKQVKGNFL
ncbi:MAG: NAD-dependent epimerase/dehydratase family protein [Clostridia bacterium]